MEARRGGWQSFRFAGISVARRDKQAAIGADWTKRGCGHRGGVIGSCQAQQSRDVSRYKPSSLRT
jgi:hypothetical protein